MLHLRHSSSLSRREALRRLGLIGGVTVASSLLPRVARAADAKALPALTGSQPGHYRFRVGDFDAVVLNDGQFAMPLAQSPFGVGESADDVIDVLDQNFWPTDQVRISINVLLIRTKTDLVLVDAGCGSGFGDAGGRVAANLTALGIRPEQVTVVILTHLHGDHFGGLFDADNKPVFKNARYILPRREHDFWMSSPDLSRCALPADVRASFVQAAQATVNGLKGKWELVDAKARPLDGVEFIDAPGHTPGHIAVAFTSGSEQLINMADVAHHPTISFARPEWQLAFDTEPEIAARTRQSFFDRVAADRSRLFGGHMPFPALGRVRAVSGKFEYVPEPWQPI